jgi:hypothetical protein
MNWIRKANLELNRNPKEVIVKIDMVPQKSWVCPHCNQPIHEKGLYSPNSEEFFHRSCGGQLILPKGK